MEILDEISILSPNNTKEAYQSAIKANEKISRRQNAQRRRGGSRGKGQSYGTAGLLAVVRKLAVQKHQEQQIEETVREVVDHPSTIEEMAEEGGLVINVIDAISGGTARLSVQKQMQLDSGVRMWCNQRK